MPGRCRIPRRSARDGPWPGVVVIHEAFGLNDDIRTITDRFAAAGYLSFAPDLLARGNRIACLVSVACLDVLREGPTADQILGVWDWMAARRLHRTGSGIAGFCLGGGGFAIVLANREFRRVSGPVRASAQELAAAMRGSCPMVASLRRQDHH